MATRDNLESRQITIQRWIFFLLSHVTDLKAFFFLILPPLHPLAALQLQHLSCWFPTSFSFYPHFVDMTTVSHVPLHLLSQDGQKTIFFFMANGWCVMAKACSCILVTVATLDKRAYKYIAEKHSGLHSALNELLSTDDWSLLTVTKFICIEGISVGFAGTNDRNGDYLLLH